MVAAAPANPIPVAAFQSKTTASQSSLQPKQASTKINNINQKRSFVKGSDLYRRHVHGGDVNPQGAFDAITVTNLTLPSSNTPPIINTNVKEVSIPQSTGQPLASPPINQPQTIIPQVNSLPPAQTSQTPALSNTQVTANKVMNSSTAAPVTGKKPTKPRNRISSKSLRSDPNVNESNIMQFRMDAYQKVYTNYKPYEFSLGVADFVLHTEPHKPAATIAA